MKTKITSFKRRDWAAIKLLFFCVAVSLVAWQSAIAADYRLVHAFEGEPKDGDKPIWGSSLLASGSTLYGMTALGGDTTNGALFQINVNGTGMHLIHSFNGYSVINPSGSKNDGAYAVGTPILVGSTLYGMTQQGGSNRLGTIFKVNTDGGGFQILHHFGNIGDGDIPYDSLIVSGTNLFGLTQGDGTNGVSEGIVFSIGIDGGGYQILHDFMPGDGGGPQGSLILAGSTLYGMCPTTIFKINTDGNGYQVIHNFTGTTDDGSHAFGSLIVSGSTLYGMTYSGGINNLGTVFQISTNGDGFHLLHSFALTEAWNPYGGLALSGSTLYGITHDGFTNYHGASVGSGAVFQINTDGSQYQVLHTFLFPITSTDGSMPFGSPLVLGSELYGMTSLGGSVKHDDGCIFALNLAGGSGSGSGAVPGAPTLTITSPREKATVTTASLTVTGTTHDTAAVTNVVVQLNNVALSVTSSDNFKSWTAAATNLPPGTNTVVAYAQSSSGKTSATKSQTFFYKLTAKLTTTINGHGSLSPNENGKTLNINENYTIKAIPGPGFGFSDWTASNSAYLSSLTSAKLTFQMVSNLQLTANFLDAQPPTVTITTKKGTGSNSVVVISGTAKDNLGVAAVWCQVGSNGWNLAATGDNYADWTATVILNSGADIIEVYAEDEAGNRSKTNSVTLTEHSTGLALESIAGTMLELISPSNQSAVLSFDGSTFSQVGSNGVTSGVGNYTYSLNDLDTGELATTFTAPPTTVSNGSGETFLLFFTNGTSGTWTNLDTNSGTFTFSDASATVPDSLSGLALQGTNIGTNIYQFTNEYGDGTFTSTNTAGSSSGTCTFAQYSPDAGLLQENFTNGTDLGTTNFIMLSFLTDSQSYFIESDTTNGASTNSGAFSIAEGASMEGYIGPESLAGLSFAGTQVNTDGSRKSFMGSAGAGTFGLFTMDTNQDSGVGSYIFTRTGTKTALFTNTFLAPPEVATNNGKELVPLYFINSHSANYTNSDGHGTWTFSAKAATVPPSLVGKTLSGSNKGHAGGFAFGYGTFSGVAHDSGETGNYTYAIYGPQVAMAILTYTDSSDTGKTDYLELWFKSATGGNFRQDDGSGKISTGSFTMK